ncbi:MAG: hypothetical protein WA790_15300 [Sulfitobacter sp.]
MLPIAGLAADIDRFTGTYSGTAEFTYKGEAEQRDMSVVISPKDEGFSVRWTSVTRKLDGRNKEKTYEIDFAPSARDHIFGSTMKTNVFGKAIPLNPLEGEPYVWSRIVEDTFTVYSLFINEAGGYEMQEYHRTLTDGGLDLVFRRVGPGLPEKEIKAFLERVD